LKFGQRSEFYIKANFVTKTKIRVFIMISSCDY